MILSNTNYSKIELVNGNYYMRLNNGNHCNLFLYKYRRINDSLSFEEIINTDFDYDIAMMDEKCDYYLYFTYSYIAEPEEIIA